MERGLGAQPPPEGRPGHGWEPGWSARRIDRLVGALGASSYLEIGVNRGTTLLAVRAPYRVGVDPRSLLDPSALQDQSIEVVTATSDTFFASLPPERTFDIVFVDGLHTFDQTYRDLCNSLLHTHARSAILLDDTLPSDPWSAIPDQARSLRLRQEAGRAGSPWHGDVYKVVAAIHSYHPGLDYRTIVGSGNPQTLVWRGRRQEDRPPPLDWDSISRMSYFDLLDGRELLNEATEDDAIGTCVAALQAIPSRHG